MIRSAHILIAISAALAFSTQAVAAEFEYDMSTEFEAGCLKSGNKVSGVEAKLTELEWSTSADKDIQSLVTPDLMFKKAKLASTYEVELSNGAFWYAGVEQVKIERKKAIYCAMAGFYGAEDLAAMERDYRVSFPTKPEIVTGNGERRLVTTVAGKDAVGIYQQQEIPGEDDLFLVRLMFIQPYGGK